MLVVLLLVFFPPSVQHHFTWYLLTGGAEEDIVDEEVQKVLHEVAGDAVAAMPQAGTAKVEAPEAAKTEEVNPVYHAWVPFADTTARLHFPVCTAYSFSCCAEGA
jgi:hypothetical protein